MIIMQKAAVCSMHAATLAFFALALTAQSTQRSSVPLVGPSLEAPIQVLADNAVIDVAEYGSYASPLFIDIDDDATKDLVVGTGDGYIIAYVNVGSAAKPQFLRGKPLCSKAGIIHLRGGGASGISMRCADMWGDGVSDIVVGSASGTVTVIPRSSPAAFGEPVELMDSSGDILALGMRWHSATKKYVGCSKSPITKGSLAISCCPWDADRDGDLDLVMCDTAGFVYISKNVGSRHNPIFEKPIDKVTCVDGSCMRVLGGHGSVEVVDWDGDGGTDLVTGCAYGSIMWFRNVRSSGPMSFEAAAMILDQRERRWVTIGSSTSVSVVDYNSDGALDVLVGDRARNTPLAVSRGGDSESGFVWVMLGIGREKAAASRRTRSGR